jgi:hypothetical protein
METDELRGIADEARAQLQRARRLWLRRYVRNRVDDKLEPGSLERALAELRAEASDSDETREVD